MYYFIPGLWVLAFLARLWGDYHVEYREMSKLVAPVIVLLSIVLFIRSKL